jgi:hypothetical protein
MLEEQLDFAREWLGARGSHRDIMPSNLSAVKAFCLGKPGPTAGWRSSRTVISHLHHYLFCIRRMADRGPEGHAATRVVSAARVRPATSTAATTTGSSRWSTCAVQATAADDVRTRVRVGRSAGVLRWAKFSCGRSLLEGRWAKFSCGRSLLEGRWAKFSCGRSLLEGRPAHHTTMVPAAPQPRASRQDPPGPSALSATSSARRRPATSPAQRKGA